MLVNESRIPARSRASEPSPTGRFGAALRAARDAAARRRPGAGAGPLADPQPLAVRRAVTARGDAALRVRRDVFREEERMASPAPAAVAPRPPSAEPPGPVGELRAVVRALPAAIEASRLRDGAPLTLAFGRSLSVDVRRGAGGIELVLRPDAALARAAEAELPAVVAALRARGLHVARADVLPRAHAGPAGARAAR
jgi:hypothetical protein